jgi:hypothetical protein
VEHVRDDPPLGALAAPCERMPMLEQRAQVGDQWESTACHVLRRAGPEPHEAAGEIHVRPPQREHLGSASR